jgi:plasmid stabilization system protein ParE
VSLRVVQTPESLNDIALQAEYYATQGGVALAASFAEAIKSSVRLLAVHPWIGKVTGYDHPKLAGMQLIVNLVVVLTRFLVRELVGLQNRKERPKTKLIRAPNSHHALEIFLFFEAARIPSDGHLGHRHAFGYSSHRRPRRLSRPFEGHQLNYEHCLPRRDGWVEDRVILEKII